MVDSSLVLWGQTLAYSAYCIAIILVVGWFGYRLTKTGKSKVMDRFQKLGTELKSVENLPLPEEGPEDQEYRIQLNASPNRSTWELPVAVLIDRSTANAAEAFALALKERDRATLIGEKTFGIGAIQEIVPIEGNAGLVLTVARLLGPTSGSKIHGVGISPHIDFERQTGEKSEKVLDDPAVQRAIQHFEESAEDREREAA